MRVLVVEDEDRIRESIVRRLEREGYSVDEAEDGRTGAAAGISNVYGVIVLDLLLPELNGIQVCSAIRAGGVKTPVLMLTALGSVEDKVTGLDAGADDYLPKPFAFQELLARIRALTRRTTTEVPDGLDRYEDLVLDVRRREATRGERPIALTTTEFKLLEYLIINRTIVLSRGKILDEIWGFDFDGDPKIVDTYVYYLRKKIDLNSEKPLIRTVRGAGYCLGGGH